MRPLAVEGAWEVTLRPHHDERGAFAELYSVDRPVGPDGPMPVALAGLSVSRRGVVRGIHYVSTPPGQARYVTCVAGEVLDVVVDLRVGSPTFGRWDSVRLGPGHWRAVQLAPGLGHGFTALTEDATVLYLCSAPYRPELERAVHPLDPELALPWPEAPDRLLSDRDRLAPTLAEAWRAGLLPLAPAARAAGSPAGPATDPTGPAGPTETARRRT
ncbi:dTDP-4-dehydrorhamnose 3,5-epimerase family protein [Kitasatospora sp. A2-31]|uniref:dTDP-4-dehydrorhamnose 3,5-epimerase family protein n=1 Tax=Kitasatospora sp. A2-31 TaxID=2916414 RepID=UPI001EEC3C5E|nr:dTDP-4-dehydrorhamnose 3,5-epimerase family protein [Kitasatospora sp. A2-31]MCG6495586.1 dTDP-4-dehydrorhamnose 3,5-epimerase family protein [Kitasatospora sp. A2-31]